MSEGMSGSRPVVVAGRLMEEPKLRRSGFGEVPFLKMRLAVARRGK
ncbi:MAG: hypothetical protein HY716_06440 [Planctomycetes bacterium]|nr:hypothetical protein [Planctomycetota bacterium]